MQFKRIEARSPRIRTSCLLFSAGHGP